MVGLRGLWRLHWGPIREDLVCDFLRGFKNINETEIKAIMHRKKVKIVDEVIFEMLQVFNKGLDMELSNPLQEGVTKICKKLVDEMVMLGKKGRSIIKMNGWYVQKVGAIFQMV